jgi:peptidoglycan LD-endopeptidase CwlK
MPKFSKKSLAILEDVHPELQTILHFAISIIDFTVIEGPRTIQRQSELFANRKTKTMNSKHIIQDDGYSHAVDLAPYPIDWENRERFSFLAGIIIGIAAYLKDSGQIEHSVRWGGDWDSDGDIYDNIFDDLPHFELI